MTQDETFMAAALHCAEQAASQDEVPVGAVLVCDEVIIAQAHNQSIQLHDASAHAEIQVLRQAGQLQKNYRLANTTLYVTLEPCAMCFGALVHARIARLVFATSDPKSGVLGGATDFTQLNHFNHHFEVSSGVLAEQSRAMLQAFFRARR